MSSKPQQICFKIIRKFINTSVLRETNGSNFETKLFASVPDIVNGHVVYWKAMRLGSVHFYDCFSPSTVFDLKRVRVNILNKWKHTKKTLQNHIYAPPPPPTPNPQRSLSLRSDQSKISVVAISLGNCEGGSVPRGGGGTSDFWGFEIFDSGDFLGRKCWQVFLDGVI